MALFVVQQQQRRRRPTVAVTAAAAALLCVGALASTGCSQQTLESAQEDAERNIQTVRREAKPALKKLDNGGRVTAAIQANKQLPSTIRVDADTDGVKLRGTVKTAQQKDMAEQIARDTLGPDLKVVNDLKVSGG
jgi:Putative phospholipid-binding domain.